MRLCVKKVGDMRTPNGVNQRQLISPQILDVIERKFFKYKFNKYIF